MNQRNVLYFLLVDDCCKMTCLADNAEERTKSNYIKAHHFNDDD